MFHIEQKYVVCLYKKEFIFASVFNSQIFYPICLFHIKTSVQLFPPFQKQYSESFFKTKKMAHPRNYITYYIVIIVRCIWLPMYTSTTYNKLANKTLFKFSLSAHIVDSSTYIFFRELVLQYLCYISWCVFEQKEYR